MRILRLICFAAALCAAAAHAAERTQIAGPQGTHGFGIWVLVLANGNIAVADPYWTDDENAPGKGAVYLYTNSGVQISQLHGTQKGDGVGSSGLYAVGTNRVAVSSELWNGGRGAITVFDGSVGLNATVDATNSLTGPDIDSGTNLIAVLPNGNFVAESYEIDGTIGAMTWCSGENGCPGVVSAGESLIGSGDVGYLSMQIVALDNGAYAVRSPKWNDARGAVTVCPGDRPCVGAVSAANSIVGEKAGDAIGQSLNQPRALYPLRNGSFVLVSEHYSDGSNAVGAATLFAGTPGITGTVNAANSLTGVASIDLLDARVIVLGDDNYVVVAPFWNNGSMTTAGAAMWCDGTQGCAAHIDASRALVGSRSGDSIGSATGAALAGSAYVIASPGWSNGAKQSVGAATFCADHLHCVGQVSSQNSLIGAKAYDTVASGGVTALSNGNYVVASPYWQHGINVVTGAATLCTNVKGCSGTVSAANSWITSYANPSTFVASQITTLALPRGHFAVYFNYGWETTPYLGTLTWSDGVTPFVGVASASNSLVDIPIDEEFPLAPLAELPNGDYVFDDQSWKNGLLPDAGAVRLLRGNAPVSGTIDATNSVVGNKSNEGYHLFGYDAAHDVLVVGNGAENVVILSHESDTLFRAAFD